MRSFSYTFTIIVSLFLVGCTTSPELVDAFKYGKDDYRFLVKEYENLNPEIDFVLLKNEYEYNSVRKKVLGNRWKTVSAFTLWIPETGKWTV